MVVTSSQAGADVLLDQMSNLHSVVRMSHSFRDDINKKYALDTLAHIDTFKKNRENSAQAIHEESQRRNKVLHTSKVIVAPINSLLTSGGNKSILDKYFTEFPKERLDTIIVDDANLISEIDLVQGALRYGCTRLILIGNSKLTPLCFSLQPKASQHLIQN